MTTYYRHRASKYPKPRIRTAEERAPARRAYDQGARDFNDGVIAKPDAMLLLSDPTWPKVIFGEAPSGDARWMYRMAIKDEYEKWQRQVGGR